MSRAQMRNDILTKVLSYSQIRVGKPRVCFLSDQLLAQHVKAALAADLYIEERK